MENLKPALPKNRIPSKLDDLEFQSVLNSWLEEKGIIADIQSQIRFKMVNFLRNTNIGRKLSMKLAQNTCLSRQALNMIVADYLLKNNYEYSLSIFNTEAYLTNIIPKLSIHSPNGNLLNKNIIDSNNLLHIFELLGIPKDTIIGKDILELYSKEPMCNSILFCLTYILSIHIKQKKVISEDLLEHFDFIHESNLVKEIITLLNKLGAPLDKMKSLIDMLKMDQCSQIEKVISKHSQELTKYKKKIEMKDNIIRNISKANKKLETNLLKVIADYHSLKSQKENYLQTELLDNKVSTDKDHNKSEHIMNNHDLEKPNCTLLHCGEACKLNCINIEELRTENKVLKQQNFDLKVSNKNQQKEITVLSLRCTDLVNDFKECQNKMMILLTRLHEESVETSLKKARKGKADLKGQFQMTNLANADFSSDSITEEIVKEAKQKLKILLDESKEIETRFSFVNNI